jgi:hypothetical protein
MVLILNSEHREEEAQLIQAEINKLMSSIQKEEEAINKELGR